MLVCTGIKLEIHSSLEKQVNIMKTYGKYAVKTLCGIPGVVSNFDLGQYRDG